jgi:uncharacterized membrane protein YgcG
MTTLNSRLPQAVALCLGTILLLTSAGCCHDSAGCQTKCKECCPDRPAPPAPLGTLVDPTFRKQERNAEASDFVLYQHEFEGDTVRLNDLGGTHLKQIAARAGKVPFPILIEPSSIAVKEGTDYGYPIHPNPELDRNRRKVVVQALVTMGVHDADQRVVISPALTPGFEDFQAEQAYRRGFSGFGGFGGYGGYGGSFGGFGGGGGGFGGLGGGLGFF